MPRSRRPALGTVATLATLAAVLPFAGCAATGPANGAPSPSDDAAEEPAGDLRIFAAASLGAAFDELAERFEQQHPGVDVLPISYDGSSTLATQLLEGAPADVFASADEKNMQLVVDAGLAAQPQLFASNTLVIAVPRANPGAVETIEDLGAPGLTVVLCAPEVPCGAASRTLLADNGVQVTPASLEQNVTAVLTKVATGEADAGLVYATDVRHADDVRAIAAAGSDRVVNRYPIATLQGASNPGAAAEFVDFVLSAEGQGVLHDLGFGSP